jgi:hypothetical protein
MQTTQNEFIRNVAQESLDACLRNDLASHPETSERHHLYMLIDMGRLPETLRHDTTQKLKAFETLSLLANPQYAELEAYSALLVYDPDDRADALLDAWGGCNSNIVSAWIVSKLYARPLATHLRQAAFAVDTDKTSYLLRWYDPLITPVLHRLADQEWVCNFFNPIVGWWYPVSTPKEETWSRITGAGDTRGVQIPPPRLTEELWEALENDPFPYRLLNILEENAPSVFESDCYGVRLAKVEAILETGKKHGLNKQIDLSVYVLSLLEAPERADEVRWQVAVQEAAADRAPLETYFTD